MSPEYIETNIENVWLIHSNFYLTDMFNTYKYVKQKDNEQLKYDRILNFNSKAIIRGMYENMQSKRMFSIFHGSVYFVAIDARLQSRTYGKIFHVLLSDENKWSLIIPKGIIYGQLSTSDKVVMLEKITEYNFDEKFYGRFDTEKWKIIWPFREIKINFNKIIYLDEDKENNEIMEYK